MLRSDPRIHYKMYKAKKNMVYAALFSFAVLGGLSLNQNAKADTVENDNTVPAVQTVANSAQPTTGVTPQSMPTQSAVPTQSPAAALNTSNSAPTAQPVSAQPVVNNQANSASNVADQTQTTTLNVQPVQPARNSAVTRRANLYAQSLVQVPAQNEAQNVQLTTKSSTYPSTTYTRAADDDQAWDLQGSFTVTADQMKSGNAITIATIQQHATDGSDSQTDPRFAWPAVFHVQKNGLDYGQIAPSVDFQSLIFYPNSKIDVVGDQSLSFNAENAFEPSWQVSAVILKKLPQTIQYKIANLTFTITYTAPQEVEVTDGADGGSVTAITADPTVFINQIPTATSDDYAKLLQSGGTANVAMRDNYNWGAHIYSAHAILGINASYRLIPAVNVDPATHKVYRVGWSQAYQNLNRQQVQDNLTVAQLKSLNQPGVIYSRQADGSINIWANTPITTFQQTDQEISDYAGQSSLYRLIHNLTPDQASKAVLDYIHNGSLKNRPIYSVGQYLGISMVDPSIRSTVSADFYNDNLQKLDTSSAQNHPASSMAHGQAAVKLHVINATNGTELNQWRKLIGEARYKKIALNEINR